MINFIQFQSNELDLLKSRYISNNLDDSISKINHEFIEKLALVYQNPDCFEPEIFKNYDLSVILRYLRNTHMLYRNELIPEIEQQFLLIIQGGGISGLVALKALEDFSIIQKRLAKHMQEEESRLFPYAEGLFIGVKEMNVSIQDFIHEQEQEHLALSKIRKLMAPFLADEKRYSLFSIASQKLLSLEKDIQLHTKIEDELLIPMICKLEKMRC